MFFVNWLEIDKKDKNDYNDNYRDEQNAGFAKTKRNILCSAMTNNAIYRVLAWENRSFAQPYDNYRDEQNSDLLAKAHCILRCRV